MAVEIEITDNATYVTVEFKNASAPGGSKCLDLPKNMSLIQVPNSNDILKIYVEGMTPIQVDPNLVTKPVGPHADAMDLRSKIISYFYT